MQAEATTPERKFVLTKVGVGDYLLPGNDGRTLWRLRTYEDGASFGLEHYDHDFTRWGLYRYVHPLRSFDIQFTKDELDEWDLWETVDTDFPTRRAAIAEALRMSNA